MHVYPGELEKGSESRFHGLVWLKRFVDLPDDSVRAFVLHFNAWLPNQLARAPR